MEGWQSGLLRWSPKPLCVLVPRTAGSNPAPSSSPQAVRRSVVGKALLEQPLPLRPRRDKLRVYKNYRTV